MEYGLFTTDNALLEVIFFFMTFSVIYGMIEFLYVDLIIRNDNHSVSLIAFAWFTTTGFLGELIGVIIYFPGMVKYWRSSDEGKKHFRDFIEQIIVALIVLCIIAGLVWVFFLGNYLLVDAGAGTFCKKW